jgi:hypothetical protein
MLQLSERVWKTRLHVVGEYAREEAVYEITMVQRLGGRYGELTELAAARQHCSLLVCCVTQCTEELAVQVQQLYATPAMSVAMCPACVAEAVRCLHLLLLLLQMAFGSRSR